MKRNPFVFDLRTGIIAVKFYLKKRKKTQLKTQAFRYLHFCQEFLLMHLIILNYVQMCFLKLALT